MAFQKGRSFCYAVWSLIIDGKKKMKNTKISLWKWALGACLLFLGAQNAFALNGQICADGTVYLKPPTGWTTAFAAGDRKSVV